MTTLFSRFELPAKAITKLDGILTQVKNSQVNLKVGLETEVQTLDHLVFVNYIDATDIAGGPEKVLSGKIRMSYLKIEQSSWKASVRKSSVSKVDFILDYFNTIFSINSNLVRSGTSTITELIQKITGQSFEDIRKLTSPKAIKK